MQQAEAANAAAAAATIAIQAVNFHRKLKTNGGSSQAMALFPYMFATPSPWQFPIVAPILPPMDHVTQPPSKCPSSSRNDT